MEAVALETISQKRARETALVKQYGWLVESLARKHATQKNRLSLEDDLKQEGYIALLEAARVFRPKDDRPLGAYAYQRITWAMSDFLKRERAEESSYSMDAPLTLDTADSLSLYDLLGFEPNQEEQLLEGERLLELDAAIDSLSEREQSLVRMRYFEGLELKEISELTRLPLSTLNQYLSRAKENLRKRLSGIR